MAAHFRWYDEWREMAASCAECGWSGRYGESNTETFEALLDLECPRCSERLGVVFYPTDEEVEDAAREGIPEAVAELPALRERRREREQFEASKLMNSDQLPDLEDAALDFVFDSEERRGGGRDYVVGSGQRKVWRERARWEDWERFNEIKEVLKTKYGDRFKSVKPTDAARVSLCGDQLSAAGKLEFN